MRLSGPEKRTRICFSADEGRRAESATEPSGPWEEENRRAQGAESLSEKKAIRECREARLMF